MKSTQSFLYKKVFNNILKSCISQISFSLRILFISLIFFTFCSIFTLYYNTLAIVSDYAPDSLEALQDATDEGELDIENDNYNNEIQNSKNISDSAQDNITNEIDDGDDNDKKSKEKIAESEAAILNDEMNYKKTPSYFEQQKKKYKKDEAKARKELPEANNNGVMIKSITVHGNERVTKNAILSHFGVNVGSKYDSQNMDKGIKSLYATGLFKDVKFDLNNGNLVIKVEENPTVNLVAFEGNKKIKDTQLSKIVELKGRKIYSLNAVNRDVRVIIAAYNAVGYYAVHVEPKLIYLPDNRVNVVYQIKENRKALINKITFVGNNNVKSAKLADIIISREYKWYRMFSSATSYDLGRIVTDKDILTQYYMSIGYIDFKIKDVVVELTQQKDSFVVTYVLDEGEQYRVKGTELSIDTTKIKGISVEELRKNITVKNNTVFNKFIVDNTIDNLKQAMGKKGYAFTKVNYEIVDRDTKDHTVVLLFKITEGPKVYVNKINIKDNVRTLDKVIRREMRISEGDSFNQEEVDRSEAAIENLGYFSEVSTEIKETNVADKVDIDVTVKEVSTGSINFQVGYSTTEGALGGITLMENNLLGTGRIASVDLKKSKVETGIDLSFAEPYFMDKPLLAGIDLFYYSKIVTSKNPSGSTVKDYKTNTIGTTFKFGYKLSEYLSHFPKYTIQRENSKNMSGNAGLSQILQYVQGKYYSSIIGQSFVYNTRDNDSNPRRGYKIVLDQDLAGLGGDTSYLKHVLTYTYHTPVFKLPNYTFHLKLRAGHIASTNKRGVRVTDNFKLGSDDIRGFAPYGIGARSTYPQADSLGGKTYYLASAELHLPLGLPKELGLRGALFFDAASLSKIDIVKDNKKINYPNAQCQGDYSQQPQPSGCLYYDSNKIRTSYGVGLIWDSPLGAVIRLDYGWPIRKTSFDQTERFRLSFNQSF